MENEAAYSRQALEMLTVANEFCIYINEIDKYEKIDILTYLHHILPLMYLKGSLLPSVQVEDEQANERFVTEEQWEEVFNALRKKFEQDDEFLTIDPDEKIDFNPARLCLSDQIADIYQDMKDFLMLYQKNSKAAKQNAVAECKRLFESHWGIRATTLLKALHHKIYLKQDGFLDSTIFGL